MPNDRHQCFGATRRGRCVSAGCRLSLHPAASSNVCPLHALVTAHNAHCVYMPMLGWTRPAQVAAPPLPPGGFFCRLVTPKYKKNCVARIELPAYEKALAVEPLHPFRCVANRTGIPVRALPSMFKGILQASHKVAFISSYAKTVCVTAPNAHAKLMSPQTL